MMSGPALGGTRTGVDDVITWYDSIAGSYDELYGDEQVRKISEVLDSGFESDVMVKGVVIDVGCGTGILAGFRGVSPRYYVGIDLSIEMLKHARRRLTSLGLLGDVIAGDAAALPLRSCIANAVFSVSVFRAGDDLRRLISECARVCREECLLAYTVLCRNSIECSGVRIDEIHEAISGWRVVKTELVRRSRELIVVLIRKVPGV